jgi:hypothetical protein
MAPQPQTVRQPVYIGTLPAARLFMFAAFVCFVVAALVAGGVFSGPVLAWIAGGFASWSLAWAL